MDATAQGVESVADVFKLARQERQRVKLERLHRLNSLFHLERGLLGLAKGTGVLAATIATVALIYLEFVSDLVGGLILWTLFIIVLASHMATAVIRLKLVANAQVPTSTLVSEKFELHLAVLGTCLFLDTQLEKVEPIEKSSFIGSVAWAILALQAGDRKSAIAARVGLEFALKDLLISSAARLSNNFDREQANWTVFAEESAYLAQAPMDPLELLLKESELEQAIAVETSGSPSYQAGLEASKLRVQL